MAKDKHEAITVFCTNLRGAPLAAEPEAELGIPIYDTISTVVWKSLRLAGAEDSSANSSAPIEKSTSRFRCNRSSAAPTS